jgi:hypothetical protein
VTISAPDYKVIVTEYIPGYQMVFVFAKSDRNVKFKYGSDVMYDISSLGYKLYTYDNSDVLTSTVWVDGNEVKDCITEQTGYTKVYAWLLEYQDAYDANKLTVVSASTPTTSITLRGTDGNAVYDVDAMDTSDGRAVSVNDEVQVMGAYNVRDGYTDTYLRNTFRADTNKDGEVNVLDAGLVRDHYS